MSQEGFSKIIPDGLQTMSMVFEVFWRQHGIPNCNGQNICTFSCNIAPAQKENLLLSEEKHSVIEK